MSRRFWTEEKIVSEIQKLYEQGEDLWYRAMERNHKDLIRASERYFNGWKNAIIAAGIDYDIIKKRSHQVWTKEKIIKKLNELHESGEHLRAGVVQKKDKKLYHAALRQFNNFNSAIEELNTKYNLSIPTRPHRKSSSPNAVPGLARTSKLSSPLTTSAQPRGKHPSTESRTNFAPDYSDEPSLFLSERETKIIGTDAKENKLKPKKPSKPSSKETRKELGQAKISTGYNKQYPTDESNEVDELSLSDDNASMREMKIFTVRTRVRSEKNVGETIIQRAKNLDLNLGSIQYPFILNGYIFVECDDREALSRLVKTIRNAQGLLNGETTKDEISEYIDTPKSKKALLEGTTIEILEGQFKGARAVVKHINDRTKEVTVELIDEIFKIPITIRKKQCKVIS